MKGVVQTFAGLALTVVASVSAVAQSTPPAWNPDTVVCADSAVAAESAYMRCALM